MAREILVTGAAGFIGSHTVQALCERGDRVVGLDCFHPYYDPALKWRNVADVRAATGGASFELVEGDVRDQELVRGLFARHRFDGVIHLAALAGVRASISEPALYFDVNVGGTINLLEACLAHGKPHFVFASSSSVYGNSDRIPFVEEDAADLPLAPYPASKRSAELLGHSYFHLHGQTFTALRFFTVYGPRNRPDMMAYKLFESITRRRLIPLYDRGRLERDWTFVGDVVKGVLAAVDKPLGYEKLNLGRGKPVLLSDFVSVAERLTGEQAVLGDEPMPAADVRRTFASIDRIQQRLGYAPTTSVEQGMEALWQWYRRVVQADP